MSQSSLICLHNIKTNTKSVHNILHEYAPRYVMWWHVPEICYNVSIQQMLDSKFSIHRDTTGAYFEV